MRVLVAQGHEIRLDVAQRRHLVLDQRNGFAKSDEAPVLHGAEVEVWHGELLDFVEGTANGRHPGLKSRVNVGAVDEEGVGVLGLGVEASPEGDARVRGVYSAKVVDHPGQEVGRHAGRSGESRDEVVGSIAAEGKHGSEV